jgi:hypothetical protein
MIDIIKYKRKSISRPFWIWDFLYKLGEGWKFENVCWSTFHRAAIAKGQRYSDKDNEKGQANG